MLPPALRPAASRLRRTLATYRQRVSVRLLPWRRLLLRFLMVITLLLSLAWLLMLLWFQLGLGLMTYALGSVPAFLVAVLIKRIGTKDQVVRPRFSTRRVFAAYSAVWLLGVGWFVSIAPKQQRDWQPEVAERLSYTREADNPDIVTLHNVRNFDWRTESLAETRWQTRTVDLSKLAGIDIINSYWMGPAIAHTLVSFRFTDARPLTFSLEIRKEQGESFSALGGFFKLYELSLIAAEERDIIYTRSNVRGEQVYLFPLSHLSQAEVRGLFEAYLQKADSLNRAPEWYNTLTSNCTNIVFEMARMVSGNRLPYDYRIWVSGWLPDYLYEQQLLTPTPQKWSMDTWYERAHINPKVSALTYQANMDAALFSKRIRQDLPAPKLMSVTKAKTDN